MITSCPAPTSQEVLVPMRLRRHSKSAAARKPTQFMKANELGLPRILVDPESAKNDLVPLP